MASDHNHKPFLLFRPGFVLLLLYCGAYWCLRNAEEIVVQSVFMPGSRAYRVVSPHPEIPFYRQQLWRALFSLPMVAEEEGRRVTERGRSMYESAEGTVRDGIEGARQYLPQGGEQRR
jgi:hypothetical protein